MLPHRRRWPILLLLICIVTQVGAWAPETRVRMADEAVRFMPPSLRQALETHRTELLRGVLNPMKLEDEPDHRVSGGGTLDQRIAAEAAKLQTMLREATPFPRIAQQFGTLAHYVFDAGFPPGVTAGGESRYHHFADFCKDRTERFPLVFYGHENAALARQDYRAYALEMIERSTASDQKLAYTYEQNTGHEHASAFDDRSVPFAVASLCYSHSVNDVVRVWLTVWENAPGDMGRTPYRNPSKKQPPGRP
jgi:hypothetical protein